MNIHNENCEWRYAILATTQDDDGYITIEDIYIMAAHAQDVQITIEKVCKTHSD